MIGGTTRGGAEGGLAGFNKYVDHHRGEERKLRQNGAGKSTIEADETAKALGAGCAAFSLL